MRTTGTRRAALAVVLAVLAPIGAVASTAAPSGAALPACTKTWTATIGGAWDLGLNWSGGTAPTATDHVCITTPGTYTVTLSDPGLAVTVGSLTLGGSSGPGTQTLRVDRGIQTEDASLTATQGIEVGPSGALVLGASEIGQVSIGVGDGALVANAGTIRQQDGQLDVHEIRGDVVNTGSFRLDQAIFVTGDFTNEGTLAVNHVLHVDGTLWTKSGTISGEWAFNVHGGLRIGDAVIGNPAARPTFSLDGGVLSLESAQAATVTVYDDVAVQGTLAENQDLSLQTLDGQPTTLTFTGTWTNRGDIDLQPQLDGDAGVTIAGSGTGATLVNEGFVGRSDRFGAGASIDAAVVNRGALVLADGSVSINGAVRNEGWIDLGSGRLGLDGTFTQTVAGTLATTIDDGEKALAAGLLESGAATLAGTLDVYTPSDGVPPVGEDIPVVAASSRTGTFGELVFHEGASYDAQYAATGVSLSRRASESATRRFVRAAYQDFLGRQPTTAQLNQRTAAIDGGSISRATLVRELSRSTEYATALVQRFYADTLGRPGDAGGVAYWVGQLRSGSKTVAQVAGSFYASDEYFTRAGGTNAAWVTDLYQVFFERNPSTTDRSYWVNRIATKGRTGVAVELFQSLESRRQRVDRLYHDLLHRRGDADGIDYWAQRITSQGDLALAVFLAASGEYVTVAQQRYP